jgi:hypothetical protein
VRNGGRLQQPSEVKTERCLPMCVERPSNSSPEAGGHPRETAEWLKARLIMAVVGLLEGSYEPLADAGHLVVEQDFAGLRIQRKLI